MKLNIGCSNPEGKYKRAPWVNVDSNPMFAGSRGNVVIASGTDLPFADRTFDEIHAIHVLEHVPRKAQPDFLKEVKRVLALGGRFYVEVPDFAKIMVNIQNAIQTSNQHQIHIWKTSVFGKGRYEGDAHRWGFHREGLLADLRQVFPNVMESDEMISGHYKAEPVLLMKCWA